MTVDRKNYEKKGFGDGGYYPLPNALRDHHVILCM